MLTKPTEDATTYLVRQPQAIQGEAHVMHGVTPIENPLGLAFRDAKPSLDPIKTVPNPWCSIAEKRHCLGFGRAEPVQVECDQLHEMIRPLESAVNPCLRITFHTSSLIQFKDDKELGLTPLSLVTTSTRDAFAFASLGPTLLPQPNPPSVNRHANPFAGQFMPWRDLALSPCHQVTCARRERFDTKSLADAANCLEVQFNTLAN